MTYDFAFQAVLFFSVGAALISLWTFFLTLGLWLYSRTEEGKEIYRTPPKIHWLGLFLAAGFGLLAYCMKVAI